MYYRYRLWNIFESYRIFVFDKFGYVRIKRKTICNESIAMNIVCICKRFDNILFKF